MGSTSGSRTCPSHGLASRTTTTRKRQKRLCCSYFLNKAGSLVTMKSWSSANRKWKIRSSSGKYHSFTKSLPKWRNANRILCTARIKYPFVVSLWRTVRRHSGMSQLNIFLEQIYGSIIAFVQNLLIYL